MSIAVHPSVTANPQSLWPLSVEAYHALGELGMIPEKTELLYGFVFTKMPKSPFHAFLALMLANLLRSLMTEGFHVRVEQPIHCDTSEPEPDVSVIKGNEQDFRHQHPATAELVIEVSVTSEAHDRNKAEAYAVAGIKEFWLILVAKKQIEIHSDPRAGAYHSVRVFEADDLAQSQVVTGFAVTMTELLAA